MLMANFEQYPTSFPVIKGSSNHVHYIEGISKHEVQPIIEGMAQQLRINVRFYKEKFLAQRDCLIENGRSADWEQYVTCADSDTSGVLTALPDCWLGKGYLAGFFWVPESHFVNGGSVQSGAVIIHDQSGIAESVDRFGDGQELALIFKKQVESVKHCSVSVRACRHMKW